MSGNGPKDSNGIGEECEDGGSGGDSTEEEFSMSDDDSERNEELRQTLADLEKQFAFFQAKLYAYKLEKVRASAEAVKNGTLPTLVKAVEQMRARLRQRTRHAEILHEKRMDAIRKKADASVIAGHYDLRDRRVAACDGIRGRIVRRARELEKERMEVTELKQSFTAHSAAGVKRTRKGDGKEGKRKVREVTPPVLVLELEEEDVEEDLQQIKTNIVSLLVETEKSL